MNIIKLYSDYSIPIAGEGHKHYREGWVNTRCPFCTGHEGYHLGYNLDKHYFKCWRCGWHSAPKVISKLLNLSKRETYQVLDRYSLGMPWRSLEYVQKKIQIGTKRHRFPDNTEPMRNRHRKYLESRGFDPTQLEKDWGLLGTSPVSYLDGINFSNRIVIPISWDNKQVSFQTRAIKDREDGLRYITCPKAREIIEHKTILYGKQDDWTDSIICVEGVTDVWRFGSKYSVSTFGISYTWAQVRLLCEYFRRVLIIYDNDPQGQIQADRLMFDLLMRHRWIDVKTIEDDPASMDSRTARSLVRKVFRGWTPKKLQSIR